MTDSFIFTGTGFVTGKHKLTNDQIYKHVKSGLLQGFNEKRIIGSDNYKLLKEAKSDLNPFDYMVKEKMGFDTRYNVVPFPPVSHLYKTAENTLDLAVRAIGKALDEAGISGNQIDAWFVGTATPHQYAPGIAEFAKAYFTDQTDTKPTYSLTSACVGFNINIESAIAYFNSNPDAQHIVIAHSEVMSELLINERDFVPFSTFGDAAAAVILSRIETENKCGVLATFNAEDTRMLDFLGANQKGHLYMDARRVKSRAVPNMVNAAKKLLDSCQWETNDIDWFIPHQTGNAIVWEVREMLGISFEKMLQEIQYNYGNLSGASVPAALHKLLKSNRTKPNQKILTCVAGLGGEFGGFTYMIPQKTYSFVRKPQLTNKTLLITGATGGIGSRIAKLAATEGANLILHFNKNIKLATQIKADLENEFNCQVRLWQADLSNETAIKDFSKLVKDQNIQVNYLINTHAITGGLDKASKIKHKEFVEVMQANFLSVKAVCKCLKPFITDAVLITGSVGEDAQFPGSTSYVASKRALRGFAVNFASELYENRVSCIYYLPGLVNEGMISKLEEAQVNASMIMVSQEKLIDANDIAARMLKSVYRMKIADVRISYESKLKVIKDGYLKF
ncbi:MAG: SDR family NAD(P)-dependent oxidoreductase [Bacteroidales bacterium]|nr:SDR family NAD(P)-dependent oxidoreductase [Bacteroidales bacterium]MDD2386225.1 SDR family NAD(P)-dependent oxidoreductase [Bacteroidales bacterium]